MSSISRTRNPLIHDGTSQAERLLDALDSVSLKIDDRSRQELLDATFQYAQLLHYYNSDNEKQGDWAGFWKVETLTFLAHLSALNVEVIQDNYEQIKSEFRAGQEEVPDEKLNTFQNNYHLQLILFLKRQAERLEDMLLYLPKNLPLRQEIIALIEKDTITDTEQLADTLQTLIGFHKEAHARAKDDNLKVDQYRNFIKPYWGLSDENAFYQIDASDTYRFNEQENLDQLFKAFQQTFKKIKMRADYYFERNLDTPQLRQPHVALFLTFLHLFDHARNSLNQLTQKHLEFYYEQVLCLRSRSEVPDAAFLILELATTVDQHLIEKGTAFLAGRDSNGRPLIFKTLEDWFLNRTQVKDLKTTFLDVNELFRDKEGEPTKRILAAPNVRTVYRDGEEQPNATANSWRPFGNNAELPDGEIGFAIASPQLILREGRRVIDIEMSVCQDLPTDAAGNIDMNNLPFDISKFSEQEYFKIFLSSEEKWQQVEYVESLDPTDTFSNPSFSIEIENLGDDETTKKRTYTSSIKIVLERDHLPVVALGEELNSEDGYNSEWPVFKLQISPKKLLRYPAASVYEALRSIEIQEIKITVDVDDVQENLIVQNDQGVFDGTQKFYPFGPVPEIGDKFFIGSTEIFQKALETLQVKFDWIAPPKFDTYYDGYLDADEKFKKPFLDIKFIDRAVGEDASLSPRISKRGESSADARKTLSGRVTDKNGNGLKEVGVVLKINEVDGAPAGSGNPITITIGGEELSVSLLEDETGTLELNDDGTTLIVKVKTNEEGFYNIRLNQSIITNVSEIEFISDSEQYANLPSEHDPPDVAKPLRIENYTEINVALYPPRLISDEPPPSVGIRPKINTIIDDGVQATFNEGESAFEYSNGNIGRITEGFRLSDTLKQEAWLFPLEISEAIPIDVPVGEILNTSILLKFVEPTNTSNPLIKNIDIKVDGTLLGGDNLPQHLGGYYKIDGIDGVENIQIEYPGGVFLPLIIPRESNFAPTTEVTEGSQPINTYVIKHFIPKFTKKINISGSIFAFAGGTDNKLSGVNVRIKGLEGESYNASSIDDELSFQLQDVPVIDGRPVILELDLTLNSPPIELEISDSGIIDNYSDIINENIILFPITPSGPAPNDSISENNARITVQQPANSLPLPTGLSITFRKSGNRDNVDDILPEGFELTFNGNTEYIDIEFPDEYEGNEVNERITAQITINEVAVKHDFEIQLQKGSNTIIEVELFNGGANNFTIDGSRGKCSIKFNTFGNDSLYDNGKIFLGSEELQNISDDLITLDIFGDRDSVEFRKPNFQPITIANPSKNCHLDVNFLPFPIYNKIGGKVTDVFEDELSNVDVQIAELELDEGEYVIDENGKYVTNNALFIGQSSDQNGEFSIFIQNTFQPANQVNRGLIFNADNFIPTVLRSGFVEQTNFQIILYNQLNIFPLIDNEDIIIKEFDINISTLSLIRDVRTQNFTQYSPTLKRGFIQFRLQEADFLHGEYQNVLIRSTISLANDNTQDDLPLPNPPYTPATNSIRLCYTSTQTITGDPNDNIDQYFHLYPFNGYATIPLQEEQEDGTISTPDIPLLPQYNRPDFDETDDLANGNLYIGLENLKPGSNLSLFIQMQEGSEQNADVAVPKVRWAYLAKDNEWKPLSPSNVLTDTTLGLRRTGIVQVATPRDMVRETTLFRNQCYWLRIAISEDITNAEDDIEVKSSALGFPDIIDIRAQAILVEFENNENELDHLAQPLPADTISQLQFSRSAVRGIEQPESSFNGRLPEAGNLFYVRVSERLRHRDRAVTIYDYERLILERFPKIQRAKCLNHTKPGIVNIFEDSVSADVELAPGFVTVAVIPTLENRIDEAAAEPRFSQGDLEEMAIYLRSKTNLFVASQVRTLPAGEMDADAPPHLRVVNPLYEEIRLFFFVQFRPGEDGEARRFELDRALQNYLAPWLKNTDFDIIFGRVVSSSRLIRFVEQLPYVDAIAEFKVHHNGSFVDGDQIVPTTSRSILTTVFSEDDNPETTDHAIVVTTDICEITTDEQDTYDELIANT